MAMKLELVEEGTEEHAFTIFKEGDDACRGPARPRPVPVAVVAVPSAGPTKRLSDVPLRMVCERTADTSRRSGDSVFDPRLVQSAAPDVSSNVKVELADAVEQHLLEALCADPRPGETIDMAYRRKEEQIGAVFGGLSVLEARALHRRLTTTPTSDLLATQFSRLVEARRARLLAFLLDTRRRQAVTRARR
jgi:hypothetical protein